MPWQPGSEMDFEYQNYPDRLNLGCGWDVLDGYLNVDNADHHQPDLRADVRDLGMLPSGHYREVRAFGVLEHLPRTDTRQALAEWYRLIAPGGQINLQVPSAGALLRRMESADDVALHHEVLHQLFGTQAYTGDFHLTGFTELTLVDVLATAGFEAIEIDADSSNFHARAQRAADHVTEAVALSWGQGVYGREDDGSRVWRWCEQEARLMLYNTGQAPARVRFEMDVRTDHLRPSRLPRRRPRVTFGEPFETNVTVSNSSERTVLEAVLDPGPNRVTLKSTAPYQRIPGEVRNLYFRLLDYRLTLID